ncbi:MAG: DUF4124 domain-containing protein [Burkholderiaceae bacterium]
MQSNHHVNHHESTTAVMPSVLSTLCQLTVVAAVLLASSANVSAKQPLFTDSVFAPDSFWYVPIPKEVPLHANSAAFVNDFLRQKKSFYGNVNINTKAFASPVFVVDANAPVTQVSEWDCQKKKFKDKDLAQQWAAVPIPTHAEPADGTDKEMAIYQPATDTLWEFWQARKVDGQWQACWGGRLTKASKSDGVFPKHYGTTGTSLPFIGGQITAEELQRGEIRHVIGISLVEAEHFTVKSWPAHRSDGYNPTKQANRIPEGSRFRLNPDVNVEELNMHPVGKTIAKAAQKYGFVVWDKAGAISIRAQNPKSYTAMGRPDPYPALFKGSRSNSILNGFPWDQLQFLPKDYGKP